MPSQTSANPPAHKRIPELAPKLLQAHNPGDLDKHHAKLVAKHMNAQRDETAFSLPQATAPTSLIETSLAADRRFESSGVDEVEDTPSHLATTKGKHRLISSGSEDNASNESSEIELLSEPLPLQNSKSGSLSGSKTRKMKAKKARFDTKAQEKAAYNEDGFLVDIVVQEIKPTVQAIDPTNACKDVDHFFAPAEKHLGRQGEPSKKHNKCLQCKEWIISDITNLQRHIETKHLKNNSESKLRGDINERKASLETIKLEQKTLDTHLQDMPKEERVIHYSELVFKWIAVEWLAETDQVRRDSAFSAVLKAQATNSVKIPNQKAACKEILERFYEQMAGLKARFACDTVTGEISLTCDAWQAFNLDAYFAVTGHFIEKQSDAS
ncbi:uncharacterized protein PHACADRAFT_202012 [Phanerochaete carnosa HHB-10118-sp]|uniref:Uncharacterized protein n=1 Tax=Phanerochaete carnosa (strain HHB-10118-sp) TaxID=650164 RepID=K5VR99_PHACS|nr:uncharacterized protein PHACADRAFT_202012 [Phanerochaete carnosa HHB-10118-sp]EKM49104.1 hypothetical protein PHACADRAFT_202012 [Phanerochaete carnosa HHB-10118-sp]